MNKNKAIELAEVLIAYAEGKTIQYNSIEDSLRWKDVRDLTTGFVTNFNIGIWTFRIKSEPKLVPFTFEDNLLFKDKWVKSNTTKRLFRIISVIEDGFFLLNERITFDNLLKYYKFEDDSSCGKYINE